MTTATRSRSAWRATLAVALVGLGAVVASAQSPSTPGDTTPKLHIYGFGQGDMINDFRRNDPNWFDVNRPTKLPMDSLQFGRDGHTWFSARQSRLGFEGTLPTRRGTVTAVFDFDMFGVGIDAGQTTIRLRHAYGRWHGLFGGQLESPFMDLDVFPNILDYWGPAGMLFFRNVLIGYRPYERDSAKTYFDVAIERPGASGDAGVFADRIDFANVFPHFPLPDLSATYRQKTSWGYFKLAGMVREIEWDQVPPDSIDISGRVGGWGLSLSGNIKALAQDVIRLQAVYGHGIQNYFNDAPVDVGAEHSFVNPFRPLEGEALPIFGATAYLDHYWNPRVTTAIGWSMTNITNSDAQLPTAFHNGQYATVNLLWTPVTNVMMGGEFQYGRRKNFSDGWTFNDYRLEFSVKFSFSQHIGGKE